jgi:hypothetical protein
MAALRAKAYPVPIIVVHYFDFEASSDFGEEPDFSRAAEWRITPSANPPL